MTHPKALSLRLSKRLHSAGAVMQMFLFLIFILTALTGCGNQNTAGSGAKDEITAVSQQTAEDVRQTAEDEGWNVLFSYDESNSVQFTVKAAIPGEEEDYEYPWGEYDNYEGISVESAPSVDMELNELPEIPDVDEMNEKLQKALEAMPPEQRKEIEEAMSKAQKQAQESVALSKNAEFPPDWNEGSNQPVLGGRLELQNGDTRVIIEMSEYCVETDTVFTVTPIKENKLLGEIIKSGFSLTAGRQDHVLLNDYAVITFLTEEDPGDDVVIKSFNPDGTVEYTDAEVTRLGDFFKITGAVEHFSTVGYGSVELSPEARDAMSEKASREFIEASRRLEEKRQFDKKAVDLYDSQKYLQTIEFDEIIFTTSASGAPLQLHLRAKLVEQPYELNPATHQPERYFTGKVWLKFYTWMSEGYGNLYMICNNARIPSFYDMPLSAFKGDPSVSVTLQMTNFGGSKVVSFEVGEFDASGKVYSDVQTTWRLNPKTDTVQVTFDNMKGASEKTFITGKLSSKTKRQANKKLKWFLN